MDRTVHYRSVDPIQNLKIRVRLTCRSGLNNTAQQHVPDEPQAQAPPGEDGKRTRFLGSLMRRKGKAEDQDPKEQGDAEGRTEEGEAKEEERRQSTEEPRKSTEDSPEGNKEEPSRGTKEVKKAPAPAQGTETSVREIGWQEKVFSSAEVLGAVGGGEAARDNGSPRQTLRQLRASKASPEKRRQLRHLAQESLRESYKGAIIADPRYATEVFSTNRIFTYTNADEYSEQNETDRTVTTSVSENRNPLVMAMYTSSKHRSEVLKYQTMFIMADCGEMGSTEERLEKPLVTIRSYPDGSFDMRPGFNRKDTHGHIADDPYEFEDENGAQWQFTVENAAKTDVTPEEKRTEQLMKQHDDRARVLRKVLRDKNFEPAPGPSPDAMRYVLMAEIVAAKDFPKDQLWVEYELRYDPEIWGILPEPGIPGMIKGATHVSHCTRYPGDPGTGELPYHVAHFSHPLEFQLLADAEPLPKKWPVMHFQVNTYDSWDRYTVEGYTWMSLHSIAKGGCAVHRLPTWKPLGSVYDRLNTFFIGGSAELKDITYAATPQDFQGSFLSKFGFKAETSGVLKIRTSGVIQQRRPQPLNEAKGAAAQKPMRGSVRLDTTRKRDNLDLARVVERARRRLEAARGGPVVVRGEALEVMSEPPVIAKDTEPEQQEAEEGGLAGFNVRAKGRAPLRFTWHFNGEPLEIDSAYSQSLLLKDVQMGDAGEYYCVVTNADGKATSRKAKLTVVPALSISEHPDDYIKKEEGQTAQMTVQASGKPPLSFQWFKDNKKLTYDESCTTNELVVGDLGPSDAGIYRCEVSNDGGTERSEACRLVVIKGASPPPKPPPAEESSGTSEQDGEEEGQEDEEGGGEQSVVEHSDGEEPSSDLMAAPVEEAGRQDEQAEAVAPSIESQPRGAVVSAGEDVEFRVKATGSAPLRYQWLHDGRQLEDETEPEMAVISVEPRHTGAYTCRVMNGQGEVVSEIARLEVETADGVQTLDDVEDIGDEVDEF